MKEYNKYPRFQPSSDIACKTKNDFATIQSRINKLHDIVTHHLKRDRILDNEIEKCYEVSKKTNGIGPIKALIIIQLAGHMHIINPVTSLWGTVSKGKSGTFQFFAKNLDSNNVSEKCARDHFENLFNKIQTYNDLTYKTSYLENTTCKLG